MSISWLLLTYLIFSSYIEAYLPTIQRRHSRWNLGNKKCQRKPDRSSTVRRRSSANSENDTPYDCSYYDFQNYNNYNNEISRRQLIDKIKRTTSIASTVAVVSTRTAPAMAVDDVMIESTAKQERHIINGSSSSSSSSSASTNGNIKALTVPTARLGKSTLSVSKTIQGYWQLAGGHGKYRENDAIQNMIQHYQNGITTLDTADIYGPSEIIIGKFISQQQTQQQLKDETTHTTTTSSSSNNKITPMTKFCCFRYLEEIDRNEVRQRILKSCERLQVQQLPLVQFFWSRYDVKRYIDVALYLTELKNEGLIQEIGATNFDLQRLQELKRAGVPIVSHQVQLSALDRRPIQSGMSTWCAENDISLIGFGTVGSGILSDRWLGRNAPTPEEKTTASLRMYSSTASRFGDWSLVQELLQTMDRVAKSVRNDGRCAQANISNVAQRYVLQTPAVAAVLIGVRNTDHLQENLRTHTFQLNQNEIDAIDAVVAKRKGPTGDVWEIERGFM